MSRIPGARRRTLGAVVIATALGVLAVGCGSTEPFGSATLAGAWDLSTTLQTKTYPVNCSQLCDHVTAGAGSATLSGIVTISGPASSQSGAMAIFASRAMINGNPGGAFILTDTLTGNITLAADTLYQENQLYADGMGIYLTQGRFAGDSLTGHIRWQTFFGVAAQWYDGTFVMRRHH